MRRVRRREQLSRMAHMIERRTLLRSVRRREQLSRMAHMIERRTLPPLRGWLVFG
ncbi:MAG: hypothetical protein WCD53_28180 [Microcoleus sp.]